MKRLSQRRSSCRSAGKLRSRKQRHRHRLVHPPRHTERLSAIGAERSPATLLASQRTGTALHQDVGRRHVAIRCGAAAARLLRLPVRGRLRGFSGCAGRFGPLLGCQRQCCFVGRRLFLPKVLRLFARSTSQALASFVMIFASTPYHVAPSYDGRLDQACSESGVWSPGSDGRRR